MRKCLRGLVLFSFCWGAMNVVAQQPAARAVQLVGTWRLVATQQRLSDGTVRPEVGLGPRGVGYITYSDTGVVCAFLSNPDRPRWKVQSAPTEAELRSSLDGMVAYCGTYEVNEAEGFIVHHVQMDKVPNVAGTDRKRYFTITENRLVLRPSPLPDGIKEWTIEWERVIKK
jgi:hypothetical protein